VKKQRARAEHWLCHYKTKEGDRTAKNVVLFLAVLCVVAVPGIVGAQDSLSATSARPGANAVPSTPQTTGGTEAENFYTDRATFQSANPGLALEDFETSLYPPGSGVLTSCPQPASSAGSSGCYNPHELLPGFSMTSPGADLPGQELVILDGAAGWGTPPGVILGSNTFTASTRVDFDPPVAAVGFDVVTLAIGNPVNITIYDAAGDPINGQTGVPGGGQGSFWGVDSDTPIAAVEIIDPTLADVELLDDMEFGDPIPVELQSIVIE
jgi:hypothetical protein